MRRLEVLALLLALGLLGVVSGASAPDRRGWLPPWPPPPSTNRWYTRRDDAGARSPIGQMSLTSVLLLRGGHSGRLELLKSSDVRVTDARRGLLSAEFHRACAPLVRRGRNRRLMPAGALPLRSEISLSSFFGFGQPLGHRQRQTFDFLEPRHCGVEFDFDFLLLAHTTCRVPRRRGLRSACRAALAGCLERRSAASCCSGDPLHVLQPESEHFTQDSSDASRAASATSSDWARSVSVSWIRS